MIRTKVFADVQIERLRQTEKWGEDDLALPGHSNAERLRVLAEEFGEVAEAMGRPEDGNGKHDLRTELVQVAAVAISWVEGLDQEPADDGPRPPGSGSGPSLDEIDPALVDMLGPMVDRWGALGVGRAAAQVARARA